MRNSAFLLLIFPLLYESAASLAPMGQPHRQPQIIMSVSFSGSLL